MKNHFLAQILLLGILFCSCKASYTKTEIDDFLKTGLLAFKQKNDTLALNSLIKAEPYLKDSSSIYNQIVLTIGKLYEQKQQYDSALNYYQRANLDFLKDFQFYKKVQYLNPEMKDELPYFENSAYEPAFLYFSAQEGINKKEYEKSLHQLLKLSDYSLIPIDRDSLTILIAQLYEKIRKMDAADSIYSSIVTHYPIHPYYRYALDKLILLRGNPLPLKLEEEMKRIESSMKYGQFKRGLSYLSSIRRTITKGEHLAFYHYYLGYCHFKLKHYDIARKEFRLILSTYLNTPYANKALYHLFHIHWQRDDKKRMMECLDLVNRRINQYRSEMIYDMVSYYLDKNQLSKTEPLLNSLRKSHPPDSEYLFSANFKTGIVLMNQGNLTKAEKKMKQAEQFAAGALNQQQVLFFLGLIAQSSNQTTPMQHYFESAYRLAPGSFYGLSIQQMFPDDSLTPVIASHAIHLDSMEQNPIYKKYLFFHKIGFNDEAFYQINYLYQQNPTKELAYLLAHYFNEQQDYPGQLRVMRRNFRDLIWEQGLSSDHELLEIYYPSPFIQTIHQYTDSFTIKPAIIYGLMLEESWFQPRATSPAGALGLMQLIPATAKRIGKKSYPHLQDQDLYDKQINIHLGCDYFSRLMADFENNHVLAIASYNAGENAVKRWIKKYGYNNPYIFIELIPYKETRNYVKKVITNTFYYQKL